MAQILDGQYFNANTAPEKKSFEAVPGGWYNSKIVASERKDTKAGDGNYLMITEEVIDGEYQGRKFIDRFNIVNPNPAAVEIAYASLGQLCKACGKFQIGDSVELHEIPHKIRVTVVPAREVNGTIYEPSNEIKDYKPIAEAAAPGAPAAGAPGWAPPPKPAAAAPPAWKPPAAPAPAATTWKPQPAPAAAPAYPSEAVAWAQANPTDPEAVKILAAVAPPAPPAWKPPAAPAPAATPAAPPWARKT